MLILFDIGNTNITVGIADLDVIKSVYHLKTELNKTADEYYLSLKQMINCDHVKGIIISSVVPDVTEVIKEISRKHFKIDPMILGPGLKTGISLKCDNPKEVGSDLIADCVGASHKYGPNVLIIDLGTATKYLYMENNAFCGCVISPGVFVSIKALVDNAALLPKIDLRVPNKVLGTNTITCMQSGVTYGAIIEVEGFINRIKEEVNNPNLIVVATGGLSELIIPHCKSKIILDRELTLKGLQQIFVKNINMVKI